MRAGPIEWDPGKSSVARIRESGRGPINSVDQVFADPQGRHRGMKIELPHPVAGKVSLVASPFRFSDTPVTYDRAPPQLGEHTEEILQALLDLKPSDIARLRERGVI